MSVADTYRRLFEEWGGAPDDDDFVIRQSSAAAAAELCQARVALALDRDPTPPSEAMFGGTGIHLVIDHMIDEVLGLDTWQLVPEVLYNELAGLAYDEGWALNERFTSTSSMMAWILNLIGMGYAWLEQWGEPNMALIEAAVVREEQLFAPLGHTLEGRRIWLSGHPDLATPAAIIDWKTSSRNWPKAKAQSQTQDDLYAVLTEVNHPEVNVVWGAFVVGDRSKFTWHEHKTLVTEQSKAAAMDRALAHARAIEAGLFSYTPHDGFGKRGWHCKPEYCGSWDVCPSRFLGDEYDNQVQVTRDSWEE